MRFLFEVLVSGEGDERRKEDFFTMNDREDEDEGESRRERVRVRGG